MGLPLILWTLHPRHGIGSASGLCALPLLEESGGRPRAVDDGNLQQDGRGREIFSLPFTTCRETKIQSFMYKLAFNLTPCGKYLHKIRIRDSPACQSCRDNDTMTHFFLGCQPTKDFWERLSRSERYLDVAISDLSDTEVILGVTKKTKNKRLINWILATAKYFIQKRKLFP